MEIHCLLKLFVVVHVEIHFYTVHLLCDVNIRGTHCVLFTRTPLNVRMRKLFTRGSFARRARPAISYIIRSAEVACHNFVLALARG